MRSGGKSASNYRAPQNPFCINAVKLSKIRIDSFCGKGSEGAKGSEGSHGFQMR